MMNANLDNIFGLWLFSAYEFPNMLQDDTRRAQIRPCMTAFSPGMQAHTIMQELQKELAGFENAPPLYEPHADRHARRTHIALVAGGTGTLGFARLLGDVVRPLLPRDPPPARGIRRIQSQGV